MVSSTSPTAQHGQSSLEAWAPLFPMLAAGIGIVPAFPDMIKKTALQLGQPVPQITLLQGMGKGLKAAPTIGALVGTQMVFQNFLEKVFATDGNKTGLLPMLASSAVVGTASAPILAVFNGQTMGWSVQKSLQNFSARQGLAVAGQESTFVLGLAAAGRLSDAMKRKVGNNRVVEYFAAFTGGAVASLCGHSCNTALTRWQNGLTVATFRESMLGAPEKARGVGIFSVVYKFVKDMLNSTVESSR